MNNQRDAFKAGLFIVVSIALIFMVTVMIKGVGRMTDPMTERTVEFSLSDNLNGLSTGDDARVGGLKLGLVKKINLVTDTDKPQRIVVSFIIPSRIQLHKNAHIAVESKITGSSSLNIDNLGDGPMLGEKDVLEGSPDAFTSIMNGAQGMIPLVKATVNDVKTETLPRANTMLDKFAGTADTGKEALTEIRDLFGDTKSDFRGTMKNLNSATATIDKKLPPIMDDVQTVLEKSKGTVDSINVAMEDIKKTVANTRDITASGKSIVSGNKSKIDGMIASLKAAGDNLKNATAEVRHSPWRLLYKPAPGEMANLNLYDSARQFSEGASSMDDAASALRDALKDSKADPKKIQELEDQLDKSFKNFNDVEEQLWKEVKQ